MVNRKQFLHLSTASAAGLILSGFLNGKQINPPSEADRLADIALKAVRLKGAMYADVRIIRSNDTGKYEAGIRMLEEGSWAFAVTRNITAEGVAEAIANRKVGKGRYQYDLKEGHEAWRCVFATGKS
jgi:TldD protein